MSLVALALSCLPAAICLALATRPSFFLLPAWAKRRGDIQLRGRVALLTLAGCLAMVPAQMLLMASGARVAIIEASAVSLVAALWGLSRLLGARLGVVVGVALGAAVLIPGRQALWAADALAVAAALGGAHLFRAAFSRRLLRAFCLSFAGLDVVLVASGLITQVIGRLPVPGSLSFGSGALPVFDRLQAGGATLGTADVLYGALIAALVACEAPARWRVLLVCASYGACALGQAIWVLSDQATAPATLPGLVALGVLAVSGRWDRAIAGERAIESSPLAASAALGRASS
jgi:hypothetical protein